MNGYKTWIGIIMTILGYFGAGYLVSSDQLANLVNAGLQIFGILMSIYGNYKSHKKIQELL